MNQRGLFKGFTPQDLITMKDTALIGILSENLKLTNLALEASNEEIRQLRLKINNDKKE